MTLSLILLFIPFALVGVWTKRPLIAFMIATALTVLILLTPSLIRAFQDIVIYDTSDPLVMAGYLSRGLTNAIMPMFIILPSLLMFQIIMRRRSQKRVLSEASSKSFD